MLSVRIMDRIYYAMKVDKTGPAVGSCWWKRRSGVRPQSIGRALEELIEVRRDKPDSAALIASEVDQGSVNRLWISFLLEDVEHGTPNGRTTHALLEQMECPIVGA